MNILKYLAAPAVALLMAQGASAATFDFLGAPGAVNDGPVGVDGWKIQGNSYSMTDGGVTVTVSAVNNQLAYYTIDGGKGLGNSGCYALICSAGIQKNETLQVSFSQAVTVTGLSLGAWDGPDTAALVATPGGSMTIDTDPTASQVDTFDLSSLGEITSFTITDTKFGGIFTLRGLEVQVTPVPLPAAAWLFMSALGGLVGARRMRRKA